VVGEVISFQKLKLKFHIMKNKVMALSAAFLLSAGIAFSFVNSGASSSSCTSASEACCDLPCPIEDCPIPCCSPAEAAAAGCCAQ